MKQSRTATSLSTLVALGSMLMQTQFAAAQQSSSSSSSSSSTGAGSTTQSLELINPWVFLAGIAGLASFVLYIVRMCLAWNELKAKSFSMGGGGRRNIISEVDEDGNNIYTEDDESGSEACTENSKGSRKPKISSTQYQEEERRLLKPEDVEFNCGTHLLVFSSYALLMAAAFTTHLKTSEALLLDSSQDLAVIGTVILLAAATFDLVTHLYRVCCNSKLNDGFFYGTAKALTGIAVLTGIGVTAAAEVQGSHFLNH